MPLCLAFRAPSLIASFVFLCFPTRTTPIFLVLNWWHITYQHHCLHFKSFILCIIYTFAPIPSSIRPVLDTTFITIYITWFIPVIVIKLFPVRHLTAVYMYNNFKLNIFFQHKIYHYNEYSFNSCINRYKYASH